MSETIQYLQGVENENTGAKHTQVFMATHNGAGERLPQMERSFISFSYGGEFIEDFGLIAITDGDSITRNIYANFNDNVSEYDALDGQFYWDSHFKTYELQLKLVTDGITELLLNKFRQYFKPGSAKELILMENPNRAILARIGEPPEYEMLVFKQEIKKKIANVVKTTYTTLYRGFITLKFVADDPFWYSKENYFTTSSPDENTLKIMLEDNIPNLDMLSDNDNLFIGQGYYHQNLISTDGAALSALPNDACYLYYAGTADGKPIISFDIIPVIDSSEAYIVDIDYNENQSKIWNGSVGAIIGSASYVTANLDGTVYNATIDNFSLESTKTIWLQFDITNPAAPTLSINNDTAYNIAYDDNNISADYLATDHIYILVYDGEKWQITGSIDTNNSNMYNNGAILTGAYIYLAHTSGGSIEPGNTFYVREPRNIIYKKVDNTSEEYNLLKVGNSIFKFTTPSIYTGYNQAIEIFNGILENDSLIELREKIRDNVKEYYSRAWAMAALNCLIKYRLFNNADDSLNVSVTDGETLVKMMWSFLLIPTNGEVEVKPAQLEFNSKTGEAKGTFTIREWKKNVAFDFSGVSSNNELVNYFKNAATAYEVKTITQNIGDMVYDKYLIIEDKNEPNVEGYIKQEDCSKVTTDFTNGLNNLKIEYNYLYL